MGRYTHLTLAEREEIMLMRHEGRSQADIARATGRDRSTIKQGDAQELVPGRRGTLLRASAAHCPLKRLGKGDTAVNIIGVAVSAVIVAASIYAQYALTKWAVKSALKETRPHD